MKDESISQFPVATLESLPEDIRRKVLNIQEKIGFVPNVFLAMGHRPKELSAFLAYHDAVLSHESTLTKSEMEMIIVATSSKNDCPYCVIAHGAILRIHTKKPEISELVAINHSKAGLDKKQTTMLDFACKLARTPEEVGEKDFRMLENFGFSAEEIWDIGAITSLFALSNRMAHLCNLKPNSQFFALGRN